MFKMEKSILILKNVSKYFTIKKPIWKRLKFFTKYKKEKFKALNNISFSVNQWEKVAFIWPNWAWKSTTIKCILWILHYDEWQIEIFWKNPIKSRQEIAKIVASVFWQRSQLLYHLPLIESFKFFKVVYQIPDQIFNDRLEKLVSKFKMEEFLYRPVRKLSLWQRMKWEIVASLLHWPKAIFLDEPTVWLDIVAKKVLYEILLQVHKDENITIFLTSHDIWDIQALCKRAIIINKWEIIFDWMIEKLLRDYANKKVLKYRYIWDLERQIKEIENRPDILEKTIKQIVSKGSLEDMRIEDVSLEEVIEKFYKNN